jgi:hypothetical protein
MMRLFDQKLVDEAKEMLSESIGCELLKQRKVMAEGVFYFGKELHGLRRTRFTCRWKVRIQLRFVAAAMNIKKALKRLQETGTGENNYPDGIAPGSSTLAEFAQDITDLICRLLSRLQPHFSNNSQC